MKKTLFILITCFSFLNTITAQLFDNNLVVYSELGKVFTLYLNEEKINAQPQADVKAFNVTEGWKRLRIEYNDEKDKTILTDSINIKQYAKNEKAEFTYKVSDEIKNGKPHHKLIFVSQRDFSGPAEPKIPEAPKEIIPLVDSAIYGNLYRARNNKPVFFENYSSEKEGCGIILNDKDIQYALNLLSKTNDMEDHFRYLQKIIENNCYSAEQLIRLLNVLNIEMDKLKLAQKAHDHLTDIKNANTITKVFKYPTIKEEYEAFLKGLSIAEQQKKLNCAEPVSEDKFKEIFIAVKNVDNEYDKTKFAKKQLINNCFNCEQIGKLMNLFTHDRERLEFVQSSYNVVTDKVNFEKLGDIFQFSETKAEFLKNISKK
jgi:hypothetical protein